MGRLVQSSSAVRANWQHPASRSSRPIFCRSRRSSPSGLIRTREASGKRGAVHRRTVPWFIPKSSHLIPEVKLMSEHFKTKFDDIVAFDRRGSGPALVFVSGAGPYRATDPITGRTAE